MQEQGAAARLTHVTRNWLKALVAAFSLTIGDFLSHRGTSQIIHLSRIFH